MILFTADWHIKLGQKNVPVAWACARYKMFFEQIQEIEKCDKIDLHIIGGDLFDRVPSMDELTLYFDFIKNNVKKISGEWHLNEDLDPGVKNKFRNFRDKYLSKFNNYEIIILTFKFRS